MHASRIGPALGAALLVAFGLHDACAARAVVVASEGKAYHQQAIAALQRASSVPVQVVHLPLNGTDLTADQVLVALGSEALARVARLTPSRPYVAALVSQRTYWRIFADRTLRPPDATLLIDQPLERQLALARRLLPEVRRIGVLIAHDNPLQLPSVPGLDLIVRRIDVDSNAILEVKPLLREVDALLAVPDPVTFNRNTIHGLLMSAYRHRKGVIGYSYPLVKAGALLSAYASPELIGAEIAPLIERVERGEIGAPLILHPRRFRVVVNHGIARILGVSATVAGIEDRVYDSIEQLP